MQYQEWVYRGVGTATGIPEGLYVEEAMPGPTERKNARILRELHPQPDGSFGWGYNGGGTSRTAAAVLADALEIDMSLLGVDEDGWSDGELKGMREDFCIEVLLHLHADWRLSRGSALRWAAGWASLQGYPPADMSQVLSHLPRRPSA